MRRGDAIEERIGEEMTGEERGTRGEQRRAEKRRAYLQKLHLLPAIHLWQNNEPPTKLRRAHVQSLSVGSITGPAPGVNLALHTQQGPLKGL
jgi:hypothetical protein